MDDFSWRDECLTAGVYFIFGLFACVAFAALYYIPYRRASPAERESMHPLPVLTRFLYVFIGWPFVLPLLLVPILVLTCLCLADKLKSKK